MARPRKLPSSSARLMKKIEVSESGYPQLEIKEIYYTKIEGIHLESNYHFYLAPPPAPLGDGHFNSVCRKIILDIDACSKGRRRNHALFVESYG